MGTSEFDAVTTTNQMSPEGLAFETETGSSPAVTIDFVDLKLTLVAMLGVFGYAGWTVCREIGAVSATHPVTNGVLRTDLIGLGLSGWITISTLQATRAEATTPPTPVSAKTDGSGSLDGSDE